MAGKFEVLVGPMFAEKSTELIRRLRRLTIAKRKVQAFKPKIDVRYSANDIASHSGFLFEAMPIASPQMLLESVRADTDVVGVDEIQFFDDSICDVLESLVAQGKHVIVAGLDMDSRGEPFGPIPKLLTVADTVVKLTAVCMQCGADATRTQRLVVNPDQVLVGVAEYEARCRTCWKPQ